LTSYSGFHPHIQEIIIEDHPVYYSYDEDQQDNCEIKNYEKFETYLADLITSLNSDPKKKEEEKKENVGKAVVKDNRGEPKYMIKSLKIKGLLANKEKGGLDQDLFKIIMESLGKFL